MQHMDPVARGCTRLVQAVVKHALLADGPNKAGDRERGRRRRVHCGFALGSPILVDFCDVYGYDYHKVRAAILRRNGWC